MDPTLQKIVTALENLAKRVRAHGTRENLGEHGWHHVALSMDDLAARAESLAANIKNVGDKTIDPSLAKRLAKFPAKLDHLAGQTPQYLDNGNGHHGVAAYLGTIETLEHFVSSLWNWQVIDDPKAMPAALARRVRSHRAEIDSLSVEIPELDERIKLINEAHEAAQSLPVDMSALKETRTKLGETLKEVEKARENAASKLAALVVNAKELEKMAERAAGILVEVEDTYRITTAKGLAASFHQAAERLRNSMWFWVVCLIVALTGVGLLGLQRVEAIHNLLGASEPSWSRIWMNFTLSVMSLAAPVWFAWMATKQIGQRFRLAEDYAYKAAVAQAYEGFRREAAKYSPEFAEQLLKSALGRLDEAPLRWVEQDTHGSPWHELFESEPFNKALQLVPELRGAYDHIKKKRREKNTPKTSRTEKLTESANE